jgi:hypothetical protein
MDQKKLRNIFAAYHDHYTVLYHELNNPQQLDEQQLFQGLDQRHDSRRDATLTTSSTGH